MTTTFIQETRNMIKAIGADNLTKPIDIKTQEKIKHYDQSFTLSEVEEMVIHFAKCDRKKGGVVMPFSNAQGKTIVLIYTFEKKELILKGLNNRLSYSIKDILKGGI